MANYYVQVQLEVEAEDEFAAEGVVHTLFNETPLPEGVEVSSIETDVSEEEPLLDTLDIEEL